MRVILLIIVCSVFSLLITSCENSTGVVDNRLLYFDTSKMSYSKTVKAGDTLKVPVSIKYYRTEGYSSSLYYDGGWDDSFSWHSDSHSEKTLLFPQTAEDVGNHKIELFLSPYHTDTISNSDTFCLEFEVLPDLVEVLPYDNTILQGDTLKVPVKMNYSDVQINTGKAELIGDSLLVLPTALTDLGYYEESLYVRNKAGESRLFTVPYLVVKPNDISVGDTWVYFQISYGNSERWNKWIDIKMDTLTLKSMTKDGDKSVAQFSLKSEFWEFSDKSKTENFPDTIDDYFYDTTTHEYSDTLITVGLENRYHLDSFALAKHFQWCLSENTIFPLEHLIIYDSSETKHLYPNIIIDKRDLSSSIDPTTWGNSSYHLIPGIGEVIYERRFSGVDGSYWYRYKRRLLKFNDLVIRDSKIDIHKILTDYKDGKVEFP